MKRYVVTEGSYIADQLVAPGSVITEAHLNGSTPGSKLIEIGTDGRAVHAKDAARVQALVTGAQPVSVAPIAPASPGSIHPQAIPAQPAGGIQLAGNDLPYIAAGADGEPLGDRVARLRAELAAAEAAQSAGAGLAGIALQPEPPLRREADAGGAGAGAPAPGPLDGSIPDLEAHLATVTDVAEVQRLREAEQAGKGRVGALNAIDARFTELSE